MARTDLASVRQLLLASEVAWVLTPAALRLVSLRPIPASVSTPAKMPWLPFRLVQLLAMAMTPVMVLLPLSEQVVVSGPQPVTIRLVRSQPDRALEKTPAETLGILQVLVRGLASAAVQTAMA